MGLTVYAGIPALVSNILVYIENVFTIYDINMPRRNLTTFSQTIDI